MILSKHTKVPIVSLGFQLLYFQYQHLKKCVFLHIFLDLLYFFFEFLFNTGRLATYFIGTLNNYSIGQIDADWTESLFSALYDYKLY
jgi:hypothetical protein